MAAFDTQSEQNHDRIRQSTDPRINARIDLESEIVVDRTVALGAVAIQERLDELDREWDIERYLMTNASAFAGAGILLAATRGRHWLALPAVVVTFLFQHAVQGWCPPLTVFRRMGIRSRKEIDREKYALKALRGDFSAAESSRQALEAATT
jgi:hypothetical protein